MSDPTQILAKIDQEYNAALMAKTSLANKEGYGDMLVQVGRDIREYLNTRNDEEATEILSTLARINKRVVQFSFGDSLWKLIEFSSNMPGSDVGDRPKMELLMRKGFKDGRCNHEILELQGLNVIEMATSHMSTTARSAFRARLKDSTSEREEKGGH